MSEQGFIAERDKIAQEIELDVKILKILEENQGIAFTIGDLNNQLEELIDDADQLEFAKGNLLEILDIMKDDGKIDIIRSGEETHYIFKKPIQEKKIPEKTVQEKTFERSKAFEKRKITYDSINQSITYNYIQVTKGVLLVGLLLGLLGMVQWFGVSTVNLYEILNVLGIILIVISIIIEGAIASNQSKENRAYVRPTYGLVALVCDLIGIIMLNLFSTGYLYYISSALYSVPFFIVAVLSGLGGLYGRKDSRPFAATVGLFFGMTFFIRNLYPFLYYLVGFVVMIFIH
jgi:hypothetical protein